MPSPPRAYGWKINGELCCWADHSLRRMKADVDESVEIVRVRIITEEDYQRLRKGE